MVCQIIAGKVTLGATQQIRDIDGNIVTFRSAQVNTQLLYLTFQADYL